LPDEIISHIAYEFQQAVVETLWRKLFKASEYFNIKNIACVGGVSANEKLKSYIKSNMEKYNIQNFYTPVKNLYSTDNAAMIWVAGIVEKSTPGSEINTL
jgi:N6-L-threonylcarbamoyladenine synthase